MGEGLGFLVLLFSDGLLHVWLVYLGIIAKAYMDYRLRFFGYYLWLFAFCASLDSGPHELIEMLLATVAFVDYSAGSWLCVRTGSKQLKTHFHSGWHWAVRAVGGSGSVAFGVAALFENSWRVTKRGTKTFDGSPLPWRWAIVWFLGW